MNSPSLVVDNQHSELPRQLDLVELTMRACILAKESASYAIDALINGKPASLQAVRNREEQLDDLDRELDEHMAGTITQVTPEQARELLACMKLMLNLERVGDLITAFAERCAIVRNRLDMDDVEHLTRMACLLENMLTQMGRAFRERDVDQAIRVLRTDSEIDRLRNLLVVRHTENAEGLKGQESLHVLSMGNTLERAGDHVKNMAEELCHMLTGHTLRHLMRAKDKSFEQLFLDWLARQNSSQ